jgi:hypothetical protein
MTAKLKHGTKHRHTSGADPGTPHERLTSRHAMPGRPEGAMMQMSGMAPPPSPVPTAPPSPGAGSAMPPSGGMPMGPPGSSPDEGDET